MNSVELGRDVGIVIEADHLRLGQRLGQTAPVSLGHAASRDDRRTRLGGSQQFIYGFLLGRLNEAAGINEDDIRLIRVGQFPAAGFQPRGEFF